MTAVDTLAEYRELLALRLILYVEMMGTEALEKAIDYFIAADRYLRFELKEVYDGQLLRIPDAELTFHVGQPADTWPTADELLLYEGFVVQSATLGYCNFRVEHRKSGWFAVRDSVYTDGHFELVSELGPRSNENSAWKLNVAVYLGQVMGLQNVSPGSLSYVPMAPLGCRRVTEGDVARVLQAETSCKRRRFPRLAQFCSEAVANASNRSLATVRSRIPFVRLLDTPTSYRQEIAEQCGISLAAETEFVARAAGFERPQHAHMDTALIAEELTIGNIRVPYGVLSTDEQARLIRLKLWNEVTPHYIKKLRSKRRLNLLSFQKTGRPVDFLMPESRALLRGHNTTRRLLPDGSLLMALSRDPSLARRESGDS